jgi:ppGpp synthetase/RelA/SpoT-type nucleotidyltranferase
MQDIVGIRLVGVWGLRRQDALVDRLAARFAVQPIDRRARPSHGYRAVHLVPEIERRPVEIQVRTGLQHAWAQATEELADLWGRGIRYGEPPLGTTPEQVAERTRAFAQWLRAAEGIANIEQAGREMHEDLFPRAEAAALADATRTPTEHVARILTADPTIETPVRRARDELTAILIAGDLTATRALQRELDRLSRSEAER